MTQKTERIRKNILKLGFLEKFIEFQKFIDLRARAPAAGIPCDANTRISCVCPKEEVVIPGGVGAAKTNSEDLFDRAKLPNPGCGHPETTRQVFRRPRPGNPVTKCYKMLQNFVTFCNIL